MYGSAKTTQIMFYEIEAAQYKAQNRTLLDNLFSRVVNLKKINNFHNDDDVSRIKMTTIIFSDCQNWIVTLSKCKSLQKLSYQNCFNFDFVMFLCYLPTYLTTAGVDYLPTYGISHTDVYQTRPFWHSTTFTDTTIICAKLENDIAHPHIVFSQ